MKKLKNSAMLVVAGLCGYLALMTPDWKSELSAMSGVGYLPNNNYNALDGNISDVLMRSTSTGAYTLFEMSNYLVSVTNTPSISTSSNEVYQATLQIADVNGDMLVVTRNTSDGVWNYYRMASKVVTSSGVLTGAPAALTSVYVASGDIEGDGDDDLLLRNPSSGAYTAVIMQDGAVSSTSAYGGPLNTSIIPQGMADLDSDGDDELITRDGGGLWRVSRAENGVVLGHTSLNTLFASSQYSYAFASDLNNDGYDDIVLRKMGATDGTKGTWTQFRFKRNTPGDVRFVAESPAILDLYYNPDMISLGAIGDYNEDGLTDVILRDTRDYWWLAKMGASGIVTEHKQVGLFTNPDYTIQQSID